MSVPISPLIRLVPMMLLLTLLTGCHPSNSEASRKTREEKLAEEYVVPKPNAKELLEATAPGYVTPKGALQECLGRLVFDVPKPMEWPKQGDSKGTLDFLESHRFSRKVKDGRDVLRIGNVELGVLVPNRYASLAAIAEDWEGSRRYFMESRLSEIKLNEELIEEDQNALSKVADDKARRGIEDSIAGWRNSINEIKADLTLARDDWNLLDLGMPDSIAYWQSGALDRFDKTIPRDSIFQAYVQRDGLMFAFRSTSKLDKAAHQKEFLAFLKRWRPRAMNEIPRELGVCIPHGFIADDGKSIVYARMSMRYQDAPGVLYTIQNSNVDPKLGPETTTITAAGRALAGYLGSYERELVEKTKIKKLGPQIVKIGALTAQQGGFAGQKTDEAGKPVNFYSVFTGYSGWQDTFVLSSILVDLRSYDRREAPELTVNPPPFEQSMERLNALLKSIRLRPTEPPMPELANLSRR